jgi:cytochrome c5
MRIAITLLAVTLFGATPPDLPVEQTKKNIKVLQGLPSSQLIPVMAFMANSLGVTCGHCHGEKWESDEKPAKESARQMIALQRAINAQHFDGKVVVTCNSCHGGRVRTAPTPDLADAGWNQKPAATVAAAVPVAEGLKRLPPPRAQVTTRVVRGTVERYNGRTEPVSGPFTLTFSGNDVKYTTELSHPPEATRAFMAYLLASPPLERLAGEIWTFDAGGALVRRTRELTTPLGNLPEQIDYSDFRDASGAKLPYFARWSRADYRVTFTVREISDEHYLPGN